LYWCDCRYPRDSLYVRWPDDVPQRERAPPPLISPIDRSTVRADPSGRQPCHPDTRTQNIDTYAQSIESTEDFTSRFAPQSGRSWRRPRNRYSVANAFWSEAASSSRRQAGVAPTKPSRAATDAASWRELTSSLASTAET
jgi:hypothetical protein